ncbi:branched-chain amino acid ABC transporter [Mesorhizobium sp. B2-4-6]|uniref:branched-chain amino acid ABC transporter n=1 Tax=Mesorhizobium sp. B2-4-6 TaxID=2589943 RepID=UPI00112D6825|nr:branched-chain amino acid ABC transporter [Mesorhizobium sp. B2-4-6]TPL40698.1 branched-chain amino acid ABC transporter [Mesorhizobium sp. B2-4-6]
MTNDTTPAVTEFGAGALDSADEARMTVSIGGKLTTWVWTFAGPGHPKSIEQGNRISREKLHDSRMKEQARVNGKKWVEPEESVDEARARNVRMIAERVLGWTPVRIDGEDLAFSTENVTKLLLDPRKIDIYLQALEFLGGERSFTKSSATG